MTPCSCIPVDLKKWLILPVITALTLSACGSDSAGEEEEELGAVSEQLSLALDYVNESLPDLGNSVGATVRLREPARLRSGPSPEVREKLRIFRASSSHHLRHDPIPAHPGPPWGGAKVG